MEGSYFEDNPIEGDSRIEGYSKLMCEEESSSEYNKMEKISTKSNEKPPKPNLT